MSVEMKIAGYWIDILVLGSIDVGISLRKGVRTHSGNNFEETVDF
jgi:hypothetical protein